MKIVKETAYPVKTSLLGKRKNKDKKKINNRTTKSTIRQQLINI